MTKLLIIASLAASLAGTAPAEPAFLADPQQALERTCFQTGRPWSEETDLRSDVAIVYGIDPGLPQRIATWREHGYRIHVMTGVSWGNYQDYLYGRFDGINHEDEAQMNRSGRKGAMAGTFITCARGQTTGNSFAWACNARSMPATEAIHLEEPEFWVSSGYSEGFKREWQSYYGEPWQPPHSSVDAQWRASKLKYFLYRRALQQVFDYVQDYNQRPAATSAVMSPPTAFSITRSGTSSARNRAWRACAAATATSRKCGRGRPALLTFTKAKFPRTNF